MCPLYFLFYKKQKNLYKPCDNELVKCHGKNEHNTLMTVMENIIQSPQKYSRVNKTKKREK